MNTRGASRFESMKNYYKSLRDGYLINDEHFIKQVIRNL